MTSREGLPIGPPAPDSVWPFLLAWRRFATQNPSGKSPSRCSLENACVPFPFNKHGQMPESFFPVVNGRSHDHPGRASSRADSLRTQSSFLLAWRCAPYPLPQPEVVLAMILRDAGIPFPCNEGGEMPEPFLPVVGQRVPRPAREGFQPSRLLRTQSPFLVGLALSSHPRPSRKSPSR